MKIQEGCASVNPLSRFFSEPQTFPARPLKGSVSLGHGFVVPADLCASIVLHRNVGHASVGRAAGDESC